MREGIRVMGRVTCMCTSGCFNKEGWGKFKFFFIVFFSVGLEAYRKHLTLNNKQGVGVSWGPSNRRYCDPYLPVSDPQNYNGIRGWGCEGRYMYMY